MRSGPNIPDSQRKTVKRTLRLTPKGSEALDTLTAQTGEPLARLVERLAVAEVERVTSHPRSASRRSR